MFAVPNQFLQNRRLRFPDFRKFAPEELPALARDLGFSPELMWIDEEWPFAECLWRVSA